MSHSQATFTKLKSGAWGVRVLGTHHPGAEVAVRKRDGSVQTVTLDRQLWQGEGGVSLWTIVSTARTAPAPRRQRGDGGPRGDRPCYMCGSYYCDGARGSLCEDD